eukprot:3026173-Rhodomonas_salina.1
MRTTEAALSASSSRRLGRSVKSRWQSRAKVAEKSSGAAFEPGAALIKDALVLAYGNTKRLYPGTQVGFPGTIFTTSATVTNTTTTTTTTTNATTTTTTAISTNTMA